MKFPLTKIKEIKLHIITQIIKTELVVRAIGHVRMVGLFAIFILKPMHNSTGCEAQKTIEFSHPFRITLSKIVVHGDNMDAATGQSIQIDRQRCHQRLSFTGLHLCNLALMEHNPSHQLDVKRPHVENTG